MKRDPVDFSEVPPAQADMHERLQNWGRHCNSGAAGNSAAPMFRNFRSDFRARTLDREIVVPVRRIEADKLGQHVSALPLPHRLSLHWAYVQRGSIGKGQRMLGCTAAALHRYVLDARSMLINRGA